MSTMEGKIMLYRMELRRFWNNQARGLVLEGETEIKPLEFGIDQETAQIIRNHELNLFNNEPRTI